MKKLIDVQVLACLRGIFFHCYTWMQFDNPKNTVKKEKKKKKEKGEKKKEELWREEKKNWVETWNEFNTMTHYIFYW